MVDFFQQLKAIATDKAISKQTAMDLGFLASSTCLSADGCDPQHLQMRRDALLRLARQLLVEETSDADESQVDLDDAMDQEEDAAAANGQQL